jgi:RNA polymerase sigma-70 factor (ECF subfamily)
MPCCGSSGVDRRSSSARFHEGTLRRSIASSTSAADRPPQRCGEARVDRPSDCPDNDANAGCSPSFRARAGEEILAVESEWITTSTILGGLRDFEDRGSWERFVSRFRTPIIHLAIGQGLKQADAEDVAQESLLAFADGFRAGRYDVRKGRLSRWLFGIAYRQILRVREGRDRRAADAVGGDERTDGVPDIVAEAAVTRSWDIEWERAVLAQCMTRARSEVQPLTFRAFELVAIENRDAAAVAAELAIDIKVVYNAKHRLLKRIRELRESMEELSE